MPEEGHATLVALSGDLGAGKTTFVQGVARALGVVDIVTSPTFVLEKIYQLVGQKFARLIHIDAYRLNGSEELHAIGWDEIIADPKNLVLVEWPEKVADAIPEYAIRIMIEGSGESREVTYLS
jgi:tRNA threonylcarbamoyladenosine biosynthesis protein TsaE